MLKTLFGNSDPLGQGQNLNNHAARNMYAQQAMNQQLGIQNMAGGGMSGMAMAAAQKQYADAFVKGACSATQAKTREYIANEVEKMAEEIGAPTLLHAVVLAIRTMEIPE